MELPQGASDSVTSERNRWLIFLFFFYQEGDRKPDRGRRCWVQSQGEEGGEDRSLKAGGVRMNNVWLSFSVFLHCIHLLLDFNQFRPGHKSLPEPVVATSTSSTSPLFCYHFISHSLSLLRPNHRSHDWSQQSEKNVGKMEITNDVAFTNKYINTEKRQRGLTVGNPRWIHLELQPFQEPRLITNLQEQELEPRTRSVLHWGHFFFFFKTIYFFQVVLRM